MDDLAVERVRVFFYLTTRSSITKLFAWVKENQVPSGGVGGSGGHVL